MIHENSLCLRRYSRTYQPGTGNQMCIRDSSEIYDTNTKAELDEMKEEAGDDEKKLDEYYTALGEAQMAQWRNKAISDPYEPGSVFKLITASAALETGTVTGSTPFYCPGYIEVAGNRISCWKIGGHGAIDFVGAIKGSCNPAFIMTRCV